MKFPNPEHHNDLDHTSVASGLGSDLGSGLGSGHDSVESDRHVVSLDIDADSGEIIAFRGTASAVRRICEHLLADDRKASDDDREASTFRLRPLSMDLPTARASRRESDQATPMGFSQAAEDAIRRRANPMNILAQLTSRPASQDVTPSPPLDAGSPHRPHLTSHRDGA